MTLARWFDAECCDRPRMWGGTAWVEHTDEFHAQERRWLMASVQQILVGKVAMTAGHKITIRFTASVAFYECACGVNGPLQIHSSMARMNGVDHLYREGLAVLGRHAAWRQLLKTATPWHDVKAKLGFTKEEEEQVATTTSALFRETDAEKIRRLEAKVARLKRKARAANARADYTEGVAAALRRRAVLAEWQCGVSRKNMIRVITKGADPHYYLSTGCLHDNHAYCQDTDGAAGRKVPAQCKHCPARCVCPCHTEG